jgi:hypothetical protein
LDNHVNRVARLGAAVLIKGTWLLQLHRRHPEEPSRERVAADR